MKIINITLKKPSHYMSSMISVDDKRMNDWRPGDMYSVPGGVNLIIAAAPVIDSDKYVRVTLLCI